MATKTNTKQSMSLLEHYIDYVLTHGEQPASVYHFMKILGAPEGEFYKEYSSFEHIEQSFLTKMHEHTLEMIFQSPDYQSYAPEQKLSSYYFTFLEIAKENRSFVKYILDRGKPLSTLNKLGDLRKAFMLFVEPLLTAPIESEIQKLQEAQLKLIHNGAWLQMLSILDFWLKDTSANFEKSDAYVEKSVRASFDIVYNSPLSSLIDLGKFVWKEQLNS